MTFNPDQVTDIEYRDNYVYLHLADGRTVGNPMAWHDWLARATDEQRAHVEFYELSVYFPDLDDGLDIAEMMKGIPPRAQRRHQPIT